MYVFLPSRLHQVRPSQLSAAPGGELQACFFFLNVYLLQEHRRLVPAKDSEAKTRFRR